LTAINPHIEQVQPTTMQTAQQNSTPGKRIQSIDLLRGAVMIVMAIDHVRVYSGMPAGGSTAGIFFTRWITHYCAPTFAFFAGTSAFLYFQKSGNRSEVVRFLVTRGLLFALLEITVIRCLWMFNADFANFTFTGVIWMLGCSMVILAAMLRLRATTIGIIGLVIIFAQQIFHYVPNIFPASLQEPVARVWAFFYPTGSGNTKGNILAGASGMPSMFGISVFYVIIPWVGVMMAGYGFGQLLLREPAALKKICLRIGTAAILLFVAIATAIILTAPPDANNTPFIFKLLGQQKYPPSQLFLLMTLGPVIALLPWAQKASGRIADVVTIIGRVPMFYYLLHIFLIHCSALVVNLIRYGNTHQDWYRTAPFLSVPEEQRWGLPLLYLVWAINVVILYFACRWYARYKSTHPEIKWLKYL
jgi:uncharacterized membrane protein